MKQAHERWAEALAIERRYGEGAGALIAERMQQLALAGDIAGIGRWLEIASLYDQLYRADTPAH